MKKAMIGALIVLKTASACDKPIVEEPNKIVCKKKYYCEERLSNYYLLCQ